MNDFFNFLYELGEILEVTEKPMILPADILCSPKKIGKPISDTDIFIAGIALENDLALVTNNTKHFESIEGLVLKNWVLSKLCSYLMFNQHPCEVCKDMN